MNNELAILIFFAISLLPLSSSCQYYYSPNEGNILALNEKNDLKFSIASGTDKRNSTNISWQVGYSPIKHLGIQYSNFSIENSFGRSRSMQGSIMSGAVGAYYFHSSKTPPLITKPSLSNLILNYSVLADLYLGYEKGEITNIYNPGRQSHLDFKKTYIQGGLHFEGIVFGLDLILKGGVLDFSSGSVESYDIEDYVDLQNIQRYDTYNFTEAIVRFRIGIKHGSVYLSQTKLRTKNANAVRIVNTTSHFGVILNIDDFFRKPKSVKK